MKTRGASVLALALVCSLPCSAESLFGRMCQGVQATGQTESYGAGDNGDYPEGWTVHPRFHDNDDGTVADNLTGLVWLKNAHCFAEADWPTALEYAQGLGVGGYEFCGLSDGSKPGDWRLPNIRELMSLIDYSADGFPAGHPFENTDPRVNYWSSTSSGDMPGMYAWMLGGIFPLIHGKNHHFDVWPVRDPVRRARRP